MRKMASAPHFSFSNSPSPPVATAQEKPGTRMFQCPSRDAGGDQTWWQTPPHLGLRALPRLLRVKGERQEADPSCLHPQGNGTEATGVLPAKPMACEEGAAETQLSRRLPIACTVRLCAWLAGPGEGTAKRPWLSSRMPTSDVLQLWPVPLSCPPAVPLQGLLPCIRKAHNSQQWSGGWLWGLTCLGQVLAPPSCYVTLYHTGRHCAVPHHAILRRTAPTRLRPSPRHCATLYECCTVSAVRHYTYHTALYATPYTRLGCTLLHSAKPHYSI